MSEHENMPSEDEQSESKGTVADLDVPEEQQENVGGGAIDGFLKIEEGE